MTLDHLPLDMAMGLDPYDGLDTIEVYNDTDGRSADDCPPEPRTSDGLCSESGTEGDPEGL